MSSVYGMPPFNSMNDGDDTQSTTAAMIILFGSIIFATIGMTVRVWHHGDKRGMFTVYLVYNIKFVIMFI